MTTAIGRFLVVATVALCTPGCLVGPNYQHPEAAALSSWGELAPTVPSGHSETIAKGAPTAWWISFGDSLLDSIIERAVESNLSLQQAEALIREARASRRITAAPLYPQIGSSASYTRVQTSQYGVSTVTPGRSYDLYQVGFDANWELDVFGGIRRSVEAADATLEAAEDNRNGVLVTLMGEVGFEYVTYRSLQQRVIIAQQNLDAQQQTLDLTQRLFNAGLAPELDVQRAAAQVATTASTIPVLEEQAAEAMHSLGVLIGQPPMTLAAELAPVGPIPRPPAQVPVGLPSELLLRRPDVAQAERQFAAQTAEIGVATSDLYPRFFLTGLGGLESLNASDLFNWGSRIASVGPSITWPVFSGGSITANIALQTAAQEELLAAYRNTVLQAFQEVEDALAAFSDQQTARDRLADAVRANQRATDLARNLYAQGLTDFINVLVAEENLFTTQDTLAQAERDVALQLIALYKALGGGWEVAGHVP